MDRRRPRRDDLAARAVNLDRPRIAFVGAGRTARTLAPLFVAAGYSVSAIASRTLSSAQSLASVLPGAQALPVGDLPTVADVVFLTMPDDQIESVADGPWTANVALVHCSGSLGRDVLEQAHHQGALTGAFHPLQSLTGRPQSLAGCAFAIEADEPLRRWLSDLATALGGRPITLPPGSRALYHVSAALASNYVVALVNRAAGLWESFGVDRSTAVSALAPLVAGVAANLGDVGLPNALTGPIVRGDVTTIDRHLAALETARPDLLPLYRLLSQSAIELAAERGLSPDRITALRGRLDGRQNKGVPEGGAR